MRARRSRLRLRPSAAVLVGVLAAAAAALLVALAAAHTPGGVHGLPRAATNDDDPARTPADLYVAPGAGYDGQSYYLLANDPLLRRTVWHGMRLVQQPYRQQRIGYPALAWLVHTASSLPVSWTLVALNVLAIGVLGYAGARLATRGGRPAWFGLLLAAVPGVVWALFLDTAEACAAAWLALAVVWLTAGRRGLAALALTAAALTRESMVLVALGVALAGSWAAVRPGATARPRVAALLLGWCPVVVWFCWEGYLRLTWRYWSWSAAPHLIDFSHPVGPAMQMAAHDFGLFRAGQLFGLGSPALLCLVPLAAVALAVADLPVGLKLGALLSGGLLLAASRAVWLHPPGWARAATDLCVLAAAAALSQPRRAVLAGVAGLLLLCSAAGAIAAAWHSVFIV